ncbi:class D beta-lactamase [Sulfitobacter albidus]|uniref:Beta-lactamase n=1 Tax=Sulfitobacter albidus TaxID=2829501 RepID=A0A975PLE0_9RHOB|nr:class D beta-lactamase [Sulfitobacter albidus]QUJ75095.1 class D beta-lactamase [Sulfitobacter albidus]
MRFCLAVIALTAQFLSAAPSRAGEICTLVVDAKTRAPILERGDCTRRATPASTFKIPLALIGYELGVLQSAHAPRLPFIEGTPDWGRQWRQPTDPAHWMAYSVLWYSQAITPRLGAVNITDHLHAFGYGNADMSGDIAQSNGLERAWLSSSLQISPREQAGFLARLVTGDLPVRADTLRKTRAIVTHHATVQGWRIQGKTGAAFPRQDSGSFDYARGFGWYVGWAENGADKVVFAHLRQDARRHDVSPGLRARATMQTILAPLLQGAQP